MADLSILLEGLLSGAGQVARQRQQERAAIRQAELAARLKAPEYAHDLEIQRLRNQGGLETARLNVGGKIDVAELSNEMKRIIAEMNNQTKVYSTDVNAGVRMRGQDTTYQSNTDRLRAQKENLGATLLNRSQISDANIGSREKVAEIQQQGATGRTVLQQQGATGRTQMTTGTQKEIAKGRNQTTLAATKIRAGEQRYATDKRAQTTLAKAGIDNTNRISLARIRATQGVQVARIAAKASVENTQKRVAAQIKIAEMKGGSSSGIRKAQMVSWETELKEIAKQVSNPDNYKMPRDRQRMDKLIERRNKILDQIRRLEGDDQAAAAAPPAGKEGVAALQAQVLAPPAPATKYPPVKFSFPTTDQPARPKVTTATRPGQAARAVTQRKPKAPAGSRKKAPKIADVNF